MKRLKVSGMHLVDEDGSQVLLNGLCLICRVKDKGYLEPDIENKIAYYAKHGFNAIRLGIFWDGVEPQPGCYDEIYLERLSNVVRFAETCGVYVFLDMHQDLFSSKFIDGAPAWATLDDDLEHQAHLDIWYEAYVKSPAVIRAADSFWSNREAADGVGLLDHYEAMWENIAIRFSGLSNVIGFEPMNEPYMGSLAPKAFGIAFEAIMRDNPAFDPKSPQSATQTERELMTSILTEHFSKFDREVLMPFYNRMLKAIRKAGDIPLVTGGNVYGTAVKTGIERVTNEVGEVDSQQIYSPHGYDTVVDTDRYDAYSKENVLHIFSQKRESQLELGLPVIVGEWGNFPSGDYTNDLIEHMTGILEKYLWSSTYHQYVAGMEEDANYSSLERGYPVTVAGRLLSYSYDYEHKRLTVKWEASRNGKSTFYFPNLKNIHEWQVSHAGDATVEFELFEGVSGGYVHLITRKVGIQEALIG